MSVVYSIAAVLAVNPSMISLPCAAPVADRNVELLLQRDNLVCRFVHLTHNITYLARNLQTLVLTLVVYVCL